ncbi:hypothetical protein V1498_11345 [Peribacillus sp. SCS-26]
MEDGSKDYIILIETGKEPGSQKGYTVIVNIIILRTQKPSDYFLVLVK